MRVISAIFFVAACAFVTVSAIAIKPVTIEKPQDTFDSPPEQYSNHNPMREGREGPFGRGPFGRDGSFGSGFGIGRLRGKL